MCIFIHVFIFCDYSNYIEESLFILSKPHERLFFIVKPTRCTIFRVDWISFYMFRTVFPSIIRSSRLYVQHQVYVTQVSWLHASGHAR